MDIQDVRSSRITKEAREKQFHLVIIRVNNFTLLSPSTIHHTQSEPFSFASIALGSFDGIH